jgi:hypothetical protein
MAHQRWKHENGFIVSELNGLVLDVKDAKKEKGAEVITWTKKDHDNLNQKWDFKDGYIISRFNGLVLDVKGGEKSKGASVCLWEKKSAPNNQNQQWKWNGTGGAIKSCLNGLVLDIKSAQKEKGGQLILWDKDTTYSSRQKIPDNPHAANQLWKYENGFLVSKLNGLVLDVKGASKDEGAEVVMWNKKSHDNANQLWDLEKGWIKNRHNGLVLEVKNAQFVHMARKKENDKGQLWSFKGNEGYIVNKMNGLVLDIKGNNKEPGATLHLYSKKS